MVASGVAMAITTAAASTSVNANGAAIAPVTVRDGASELGDVMTADIGMASAHLGYQPLCCRLAAGGAYRRRADRRDEGHTGGQEGRRSYAQKIHERFLECVPTG